MAASTPFEMTPPIPASTPRRRAPAGTVDCHMHIMGPNATYPLAEGREYNPPDCLLPDYLAMCDVLGIERTVIVNPSVYGTDNACTIDAVHALGPKKGRAVAVLDSTVSDLELKEMDSAGFRGTRFNMVNGLVGLDHLSATAAKVAALGWHIQVFVPGAMLVELADALADLPCEIVVDHHGMVDGPEGAQIDALMRLLDNGRTWVKLAGLYRVHPEGKPRYEKGVAISRVLVGHAPERMVWGTDWPHPSLRNAAMPDDGDLLNGLFEGAGDEATAQRILVDNPVKLYGFD